MVGGADFNGKPEFIQGDATVVRSFNWNTISSSGGSCLAKRGMRCSGRVP